MLAIHRAMRSGTAMSRGLNGARAEAIRVIKGKLSTPQFRIKHAGCYCTYSKSQSRTW